MNNPERSHSAWERSTTRRILIRLTDKRVTRRFVFVLAATLTILVFLYTFENWRGKRAWRAYKEELRAKGIILEFAALLPASIPSQSNFAATPFFADVFHGKPSPNNVTNRWPNLFENARTQVRRLRPRNRDNERDVVDLVAWQNALRAQLDPTANALTAETSEGGRRKAAQDILAALKVYGPVLEELREASARPQSRYLVQYEVENPWGVMVPHLGLIKQIQEVLQVRASAELAAGDKSAAFDDLQLQLRLVESLDSEPFLISHLVQIAVLQIALNTLWEGMAQWSDTQLELVQARLARLNLVAGLRKACAAEQSAAVVFVDLLQRDKYRSEMVRALLPETPRSEQFVISVYPTGWFEFERRNYVEMFQNSLVSPVQASSRVIDVAAAKAGELSVRRDLSHPIQVFLKHRYLARMLMPALGNAQSKTAQGQAAANQATIACALERYRRAHSKVPQRLDELTPKFLRDIPNDPVNGGPMRYKPGRIYSLGWDEQDDGGVPGKTLFASEGDWVWMVRSEELQ